MFYTLILILQYFLICSARGNYRTSQSFQQLGLCQSCWWTKPSPFRGSERRRELYWSWQNSGWCPWTFCSWFLAGWKKGRRTPWCRTRRTPRRQRTAAPPAQTEQKKQKTGRNDTDESDQMLPSLQMLIKPTAHNCHLDFSIRSIWWPPPPLRTAKSCQFPASIRVQPTWSAASAMLSTCVAVTAWWFSAQKKKMPRRLWNECMHASLRIHMCYSFLGRGGGVLN